MQINAHTTQTVHSTHFSHRRRLPANATAIAATVVFIAASSAMAAIPATPINYFVAPDGSDDAAGAPDAPFRTLARAARAATQPGTIVWVAPGTYTGGVRTVANGTASSRIYWVSTTKWGATIVPPANSSSDYAWDNRGDHVSIIGFHIDGSAIGSGKKWLHGIYSGGSFSVIEGNHIHHLATAVPCNGGGGAGIGVDSYYQGVQAEVAGNFVHDIGPAGCDFIQGIYLSTSGSVKNNVVYRIGAAAIHLWHDAKDVQIVNNTVASSGYGVIVGGGDFYFSRAGANNVHVHNNIVVDNGVGLSEVGVTGTANTYQNNLVSGNRADIQLQHGLADSGTVRSAPLFADNVRAVALATFALSASSPAVGRGMATFAPPDDVDGKARSGGVDIGAYEL